MVQTREGAIKSAANKLGISAEEYKDLVANGLKRCSKCQTWKNAGGFGKDDSRHDKKNAKCFECVRVKTRKTHKGRVSPFKGKNHSPESKLAISMAKKGKPNSNQHRIGAKHTCETRKKISDILRTKALRGKDCHSYKDGKYAERRGQRETAEYKQWRYSVYLRDKFACQFCGDARGGNLNAHHIFAFADYPDLRTNLDNGITLCKRCHEEQHYKAESIRNMRKNRGLIKTIKLIKRNRHNRFSKEKSRR